MNINKETMIIKELLNRLSKNKKNTTNRFRTMKKKEKKINSKHKVIEQLKILKSSYKLKEKRKLPKIKRNI